MSKKLKLDIPQFRSSERSTQSKTLSHFLWIGIHSPDPQVKTSWLAMLHSCSGKETHNPINIHSFYSKFHLSMRMIGSFKWHFGSAFSKIHSLKLYEPQPCAFSWKFCCSKYGQLLHWQNQQMTWYFWPTIIVRPIYSLLHLTQNSVCFANTMVFHIVKNNNQLVLRVYTY